MFAGVVAAIGCAVPDGPRAATNSGDACLDCEANNCPHDSHFQPDCQDFSSADRASCQNVLDCIRETNCIASGNVACFCGNDLDIVSCKKYPVGGTTGAHGACVSQIRAAFPPRASPSAIVNTLGDVTIPGGAALNLGQCDHDFCGVPALGGKNECVPYRR